MAWNIKSSGLVFVCLLLARMLAGSIAAHSHARHNLTEFLLLRQKRTLIFQNSGTIKFSIGPSMPVPLGDPVTFRSLVCSYNLQGGQYPLPQRPYYPWDKWGDDGSRRLRDQSFQGIKEHYRNGDDARLFVYTLIESYVNKKYATTSVPNSGQQCLLRSICENAQVDHHEGLFAEILNIILTPGDPSTGLDPVYSEAYLAGRAGSNCLTMYTNCARGMSPFDQYFVDYLFE